MKTPIWPDGRQDSFMAQEMILAKQCEDESYWPTMRRIFAHDFDTLPKERFKVWASVWNVPFVHSHIPQEYVWQYMNALRTSSDADTYAAAVEEPLIGCTAGDFRDYLSLFSDSMANATRVQHLSHLLICGYTPEILRSMNTIVEMGSGIGEMPDIIYKLGFRGRYIIFDLPEVSRIQQWYHQQLGHTDITYTSDPDQLDAADLCIATWSFTEMPLDLRARLMTRLNRSKSWLIAYSNTIFGLDNEKYMRETFVPSLKGRRYKTTTIPVPYMPWNGGTNYLSVRSTY
jgi:hypothetical protein